MYCYLCPGIWSLVDTWRWLDGQGEGKIVKCALSLRCRLQLSEKHSPKQTAEGRAVLAATRVAQLFFLDQVLVINIHSAQKNRATQTIPPTWNHIHFLYLLRHNGRLSIYNYHINRPYLLVSYPLIISLHSARMKCSFSGVRMHSEFFWPVLDSPSMTSEHWFILIVPWGRVLGCRTHRHTEKSVKWGSEQTYPFTWSVCLLTPSTPASISMPSLAHHKLI